MMELVKLILIFLIMICLLIFLNGMFRSDRLEIKRARWKEYPKKKPCRYKPFRGKEKVIVLVSTKEGEVCAAEYDMKEDKFGIEDVDAWRELPPAYRQNLKMMKKLWKLARGER